MAETGCLAASRWCRLLHGNEGIDTGQFRSVEFPGRLPLPIVLTIYLTGSGSSTLGSASGLWGGADSAFGTGLSDVGVVVAGSDLTGAWSVE